MKAFLLFLGLLSFPAFGSDISDAAAANRIVLGEYQSLATSEGNKRSCFSIFHVNSRRNFNNRRDADFFCNSIRSRTGFDNFCFVRQYSEFNYETSFRLGGFAQRNSFFAGLLAILEFLQDSNLLNNIFDFVLELSGPQSC